MDTTELERFLKNNVITQKTYHGVYPSDLLPRVIKKRPCAIVVNTDPHQEPGQHWLGIYLDNEKATFFDSYGREPSFYPKSITRFINRNAERLVYHNRQLQDDLAVVCGQHVLYFLYHASRNLSLKDILSHYVNDTIANDDMVVRFVRAKKMWRLNNGEVHLYRPCQSCHAYKQ